MKINTNELGHMTNMAAMPIYGKNLKKIFFSRSNRPMTLKLGIGRMGMKIYTNELGYMTNMATMPIYGKNLKKSSTPEAMG